MEVSSNRFVELRITSKKTKKEAERERERERDEEERKENKAFDISCIRIFYPISYIDDDVFFS